jgi:phospholipid/cholesterol/gamma-HCH transport system permease protein
MALLDDRPKADNRFIAAVDRRFTFLDVLGDQIFFFVKAIAWIPRAIRRYGREIMRLMAEVSFGSGALAVIGGTEPGRHARARRVHLRLLQHP